MSDDISLLVIDDDADVLRASALALGSAGARVVTAADPGAIDWDGQARTFDAVLLDMNFTTGARSGKEGLDALERIRDADPQLSVVLMTTFGGIALAVETLKRGAVDFILKPWRNDALTKALGQAASLTRERRATAGDLNLNDLERRAIAKAIDLHGGNISRAAEALGLTRQALYRRMDHHGL